MSTSKIAYLTIDDAPSVHLARKIDYMTARSIPAVLFCRGESLEQYPDLAVHAIQHGYIIGNHSYNHPYFSDLKLAKCLKQIERTDAIIEDVYARANVARPAKFFRFPFGDKGGLTRDDALHGFTGEGLERKNRIQAYLREMGYTKPDFPGITYNYYRAAGLDTDVDWYWTYDTFDWGPLSKDPPDGIDNLDAILARMAEDDPEQGRGLHYPGSEEIIIMHDFEQTTDIFFGMIDHLLAIGIEFHPVPVQK